MLALLARVSCAVSVTQWIDGCTCSQGAPFRTLAAVLRLRWGDLDQSTDMGPPIAQAWSSLTAKQQASGRVVSVKSCKTRSTKCMCLILKIEGAGDRCYLFPESPSSANWRHLTSASSILCARSGCTVLMVRLLLTPPTACSLLSGSQGGQRQMASVSRGVVEAEDICSLSPCLTKLGLLGRLKR